MLSKKKKRNSAIERKRSLARDRNAVVDFLIRYLLLPGKNWKIRGTVDFTSDATTTLWELEANAWSDLAHTNQPTTPFSTTLTSNSTGSINIPFNIPTTLKANSSCPTEIKKKIGGGQAPNPKSTKYPTTTQPAQLLLKPSKTLCFIASRSRSGGAENAEKNTKILTIAREFKRQSLIISMLLDYRVDLKTRRKVPACYNKSYVILEIKI
ncbi:hypothetical protein DFH27DRAFT_377357 [Peziza echinospora]|nr:hypothetical protein DFH27DRAFT_377357 [Peziza echinospora]